MQSKFSPEGLVLWNEAQRFFGSNEALLEKVQNDVGGHFGLQAAIYSIENLQSTATGTIEFVHKSEKLHFVSQIAGVAVLRHVPGNDPESKIRYLTELIFEGYRRSRDVVNAVIAFYLWERFGH